jgi:hypothetical protein
MPPPPTFISADVAETLPSEFSGKSHCSDGRPIQSSCGGQSAHQSQRCDVRETNRPEMDVGVAPDPQEAFVIDEEKLIERIESIEIEQILRALFQKTA